MGGNSIEKIDYTFFSIAHFNIETFICELWFCFSLTRFYSFHFLSLSHTLPSSDRVCVCVWAKLPHETGCELFEIIQCEGYNENRFRNDLKLLFTQIGVRNQRTVVLFSIINDQVSQPNCIYFVGSRKKNNHEEARHYIARHFCWCCCCCMAMRWNFENVRTIR